MVTPSRPPEVVPPLAEQFVLFVPSTPPVTEPTVPVTVPTVPVTPLSVLVTVLPAVVTAPPAVLTAPVTVLPAVVTAPVAVLVVVPAVPASAVAWPVAWPAVWSARPLAVVTRSLASTRPVALSRSDRPGRPEADALPAPVLQALALLPPTAIQQLAARFWVAASR